MAILCVGLGACSSGLDALGGSGGGAGDEFSVSTDVEWLRVRQSESAEVAVEVQRSEVRGDIEVAVEGLPSAAVADSITIPAGSSSGTLTIETLVMTAQGGPQPITIAATSLEDTTRTTQTGIDLYIAGRPGTLDASFNFDRYSVAPGSLENPRDVAVDSRGRILIAGRSEGGSVGKNGFLLRFLNDGAIDQAFGEGGEVHDFGPGESFALQVLVRPDDSLLVFAFFNDATTTLNVSYLRAFDPTGAIDTDYGTGGDVLLEGLDPQTSRFISRQSDLVFYATQTMQAFDLQGQTLPSFNFEPIPINEGSILAVGADLQDRVLFSYLADDWTIRRTRADGTPDTSFAAAGWLIVDPPSDHSMPRVRPIATRPNDGGVAMASSQADGASSIENRVVLIRFGPDGTLDPGFGSGGVLEVLPESDPGFGRFVLVQPDDGIITVLTQNSAFVRRFNPDGSVDATFGSNGSVALPFFPSVVGHDVRGDRLIIVGTEFDTQSSTSFVTMTRIWL